MRYIKKPASGRSCSKADNDIHRRNLYPVDGAIGVPNTYLLESDVSKGQHYPSFELPGPEDLQPNTKYKNNNR